MDFCFGVRAAFDERAAAPVADRHHERRPRAHLTQEVVVTQIDEEILRVRCEGKRHPRQRVDEQRRVRRAVGEMDVQVLDPPPPQQVREIHRVPCAPGGFVAFAVAGVVVSHHRAGPAARVTRCRLDPFQCHARRRVKHGSARAVIRAMPERTRRRAARKNLDFVPRRLQRAHLHVAERLRRHRVAGEEISDFQGRKPRAKSAKPQKKGEGGSFFLPLFPLCGFADFARGPFRRAGRPYLPMLTSSTSKINVEPGWMSPPTARSP